MLSSKENCDHLTFIAKEAVPLGILGQPEA